MHGEKGSGFQAGCPKNEKAVSNSAKFIKRIALRVKLQYNLKAGHGKNAA
jgi:hypothetical protein